MYLSSLYLQAQIERPLLPDNKTMNRNLANYIFLSETLYQSPAKKVVPEVSAIKEVVSEQTAAATLKPETAAPAKNIPAAPAETTPAAPAKNTPAAPTYQMKTKHLVVVKNLQQAEREMLGKILNAIDLNLEFVDLLDVNLYPDIDFKTLIYGNMPKAILYFGPESGGEFLTKLRLEIYTPKTLKEIRFLVADSLSQILLNAHNEKRKLWEALKVVFDK